MGDPDRKVLSGRSVVFRLPFAAQGEGDVFRAGDNGRADEAASHEVPNPGQGNAIPRFTGKQTHSFSLEETAISVYNRL